MRDKIKYREYLRDYMRERWKTRRELAIKQLGSKCVKCGSLNNLEFDHIDPNAKSFSIAKGSSLSEIKFQDELNKCQLLCKECHIEKTSCSRSVTVNARYF